MKFAAPFLIFSWRWICLIPAALSLAICLASCLLSGYREDGAERDSRGE